MDDEAAEHSRATFKAASKGFDDEALSFFVRFGIRSVEHAHLRPGDRVLDVACGTGNSTIPASEKVGPDGSVLGVDLSEEMLALAGEKVERAGAGNVQLRTGDMRDLGLPPGSSDVVLCVFGVFFAPDMAQATRELWRLVAPGGRLVMTVWGPDLMEPARGTFWDAVRAEDPELVPDEHPTARIADPETFRAMLLAAGIPDASIEILAEPGQHPLRTPEDFWTIVMGTGMRAVAERLSPDARERVRHRVLGKIVEEEIDSLTVNVLYARVTKVVG